MAPEILCGQVSYTREAVLQADVYSMALVMWEVLSRADVSKSGNIAISSQYYLRTPASI